MESPDARDPIADGALYLVYTLREDLVRDPEFPDALSEPHDVVPLYIGKTETIGRRGGLSRNLHNVSQGKNRARFARWGDDVEFHVGDLSGTFFHNLQNPKYERWVTRLFCADSRNQSIPRLRFNVYFKMKPWFVHPLRSRDTRDPIVLNTPEAEAILITIARDRLFPQYLLNIH
jgi:hypothetical protein